MRAKRISCTNMICNGKGHMRRPVTRPRRRGYNLDGRGHWTLGGVTCSHGVKSVLSLSCFVVRRRMSSVASFLQRRLLCGPWKGSPTGVRVNSVAPGHVETPIYGGMPVEMLEGMTKTSQLLGRPIQADEVRKRDTCVGYQCESYRELS